jgi:sterol 24-C-methyltransferase
VRVRNLANITLQDIDQPDNSFDAVYAIEATVHAPSLQGVYSQAYRVLKPGGTFGVFEWVMTDKYEDTNPEHQAIRLGIERGGGIANMMPRQHAVDSIKAAGFVLEHSEDLAERPDQIPWYYPLAGEFRHVRNIGDMFTVLRKSTLGRRAIESLLTVLETARMAPPGTTETACELSLGADNLVAGGKQGLFTPMFFMIAKKPEA